MSGPDCPECGEHFLECHCDETPACLFCIRNTIFAQGLCQKHKDQMLRLINEKYIFDKEGNITERKK